MRWRFVCVTQEPSDSLLALQLKWGKTSSVKCDARAYYYFSTRTVVCYELVRQGRNVKQHYHVDTLWRLGDMWRLVSVPSQYACSLYFVSSWISGLKQNVILCAPFSQDWVHVTPLPLSKKKKKVGVNRKDIEWPWLKQNCRMHLLSFKQCASQNISNGGAITELTAESTKKAILRATMLIRK